MTQPSWPLPYAVSNGTTITIDRTQGFGGGTVNLTLTAPVTFLAPNALPSEPGATGAELIITPGLTLPENTSLEFFVLTGSALVAAGVAEVSQ